MPSRPVTPHTHFKPSARLSPSCAQFHFHTPSEHTVNGMHYPLEMHLVHKLFNASAPTQLLKAAVIGVFFAYDPLDRPGPFMTKFQSVFNQMQIAGADSSDMIATNVTANPGTCAQTASHLFLCAPTQCSLP